jgi:L-ribulose-5-phosphate 3-epimerase
MLAGTQGRPVSRVGPSTGGVMSMSRQIDRRTVIKAGAAAVALPTLATAVDRHGKEARMDRLFEISLAQWSLHRALYDGQMDNLDFARVARESFGIDAIEYVNSFFKDKALDAEYLAEMNRRAADHGVRNLLIMIDGEGRLGDPDTAQRRRTVENHHRWVAAAKTLGCHSIRVNAASRGSYDEQLKLTSDGLRELCEYADGFGLNVIVENHGGLSSNGGWLAKLIRMVEHPRCGTLPDFGNFHLGDGKWYDRYQGVTEMMPFAKAVSAEVAQLRRRG